LAGAAIGIDPLAPESSQLPIMSAAKAEVENANTAAKDKMLRFVCAIVYSLF
jgi:hypothetical protein